MESVSLLSQQFSSRWHCIVRMSAHTTRLIIIFSDITFTLRVLLWRRDDASVWDFDIWHERRCHDQIFIYKICSFQADYTLAFIKIYHCEAFTLYIVHSSLPLSGAHLLLLQDIGPALAIVQVIIIHCGSIQMWPIINLNCGQFVIQLISPLEAALSEGISLVMIAAPITSFPWIPLPLSCHNVPTHHNPDSG